MDAGVPLAKPVAGIAMGLIKEGERFAVLSDILGDEDHLGDMDFKVAGTVNGITSLQMDIKIAGITEEIMKVALDQAKDGRQHILGEMAKALSRRPQGARRVRAAHRGHAHPDRQDPRRDRLRRQGDPRDRREDRRQDQHRGRRHGQDRFFQRQGDRGGEEVDPHHRRGTRSRRDLRGHGRQDRRFRRLREFLRSARRPGPHLAARQRARRQDHRRGQGRRQGLRQAHGLRRARQGSPVDEGRRPEDRQGDRPREEGPEGEENAA